MSPAFDGTYVSGCDAALCTVNRQNQRRRVLQSHDDYRKGGA
jgi:hypothetical protein